MQFFGFEKLEGKVVVSLPSGQRTVFALPAEQRAAGEAFGTWLLEQLDYPGDPFGPPRYGSASPPPSGLNESFEESPFEDLEIRIGVGRRLLDPLRPVSRKGRR